MSFAHSLKWSFLSELATKLIQPIVFVVLARLLTPEDFGVMNAALMVIAFSQIFWEAGMGKALIQRQTDVEDAANVAFWVNLGLGVVIASLLFMAAEPIAGTFFQDQRVTAVIQVMTLQVLLGAVSSVHTALLQKEMGFKKLFWVRFATVSLPGLASIPLAWNGMGYWALVAGTLVGQAAQVVMLWNMSMWLPRWQFHTKIAKEMGRFGAWVGLTGLLAWFYMWADSLILGMYLGNHELGLYRTGNQIIIMIYALLFAAITPVLYSHLSKIKKDKTSMCNIAERVIKVLALVAIPTAVVTFTIAPSLADVLFDKKWEGIAIVLSVMALSHGYAWIVGMNGEFYRAMNRPNYETIVNIGILGVYISAYFYSIQYGFESFVWTRFALALFSIPIHLILLTYVLKVQLSSILLFLTSLTIISFLSTITINYAISYITSNQWLHLLITGALSSLIIFTLIYFKERNKLVKEMTGLMSTKYR